MERQARIVLVSIFLLISAVALFAFMSWISGPDEAEYMVPRTVQFNGSVSGLSIGSEARYLGVPVGRVSDILLSDSRRGRVDVVINTYQPLPDARLLVAALQPQGITGLSLIEFSNRGVDEQVFEVAEGVIPGYPSLIARLSDSAGTITDTTEDVLTKLNDLLDEENLDSLSATVAQAETISTNLAAASEDLEPLVDSLNRITTELEETLPDYRNMALSLDNEMVPAVVSAGNALRDASDAVADAVGTNQDQIQRLLQKDLPTLIGLTDELARSLNGINQTLGNINDEPGALLYGQQVPEVEISLE